jgi:tetratricopeptide (TPR) repeat protein
VRASLSLSAVRENDVARGHALYVAAALDGCQGLHSQAEQMLTECLNLRRHLENRYDLAMTLSTRSVVFLSAGEAAKAREDEVEAARIFREIDHRVGEALALLHLGEIEAYEANDAEAQGYLERAVSTAHDIGYAEVEAEAELVLGQLEFNLGKWGSASLRFERSMEVCLVSEDKRGQASATWWLGKLALRRGDLDGARLRLAAALRAFHTFEMNAELVGCLEDFAELLTVANAAESAATIMGAAASLRERLSLRRSPRAEQLWLQQTTRTKGLIGERVFETSVANGKALSASVAVESALAFNPLELEAA